MTKSGSCGSQVWQPPLAFLWQPGLAATPAAQHRTALLLGCELAHPPACGLFICSFISSRSLYDLFTISSRSLNERVCQNDNWTNSAKMASCACFVKLTLRACSVKLLLPVCCCCRLFSPAASATAPRPAASSRWCSATAPLPAASYRWLFAAAPLPVAAMPRRSGQQHLPDGSSLQRPCQ